MKAKIVYAWQIIYTLNIGFWYSLQGKFSGTQCLVLALNSSRKEDPQLQSGFLSISNRSGGTRFKFCLISEKMWIFDCSKSIFNS